MEGTERLWASRLRWRLRGAWLWPLFPVLTLLDALLLVLLPPFADGPGGLVPALLLAGFANLFLVAAVAPLAGRQVRRRRPDLPQVVAANYAGTALVCALAAALVVGGFLHRPVIAQERDDRVAQFAAVHTYVSASAPEYEPGLAAADAVRIEPDVYRTCVPGPEPRRPLCLYVNTDQQPASVTVDRDRTPNSELRLGGFE